MVTVWRSSWVMMIALLLWSCSQDTVYSPVTTPVVIPPAEIANIPAPVVRAEPRSKYGNPASYVVFGERYHVLPTARDYVETGRASWYGPGFHEKLTSTRESYDMHAMTAAHKTLPIPCFVEVTNLENGRRIIVRVNDRGPFVAGRIIDLSYAAAHKLDMVEAGTIPVRVVALTTPTNQVVNYEKLAGNPGLPRQTYDVPANTTAVDSSSNIATHSDTNYSSTPSVIFLQLGAFANQDNALALQEKLTNQLEQGVMVFSDTNSGRLLHRVQIGPLADPATAELTKDRLWRLGYHDVKIIGTVE